MSAETMGECHYQLFCSTADGLPPLWPHAPLWPYDPEIKRQVLACLPPVPLETTDMVLGNYVRARKMKSRRAHLMHLAMQEDPDVLQPATHWIERIVTPAGWVLDDTVVASFGPGPFSADEFIQWCMNCLGAGFDLLWSESLDDTPLQKAFRRHCRTCGHKCLSECMCGELYCSRECQRRDFRNHRELCEAMCRDYGLAWGITHLEFQKIHRGGFDTARATGFEYTTRAECSARDHKCSQCGGALAPLRCSKCMAAYYCSKECQKQARKVPKKRCPALADALSPQTVDGLSTAGP